MTITYPLDLPNVSGQDSDLARMTWRRMQPQEQSVSPWTGAQQVQLGQGRWWEVDCDVIPMTRASYDAWEAFLLSLEGSYGTFLMGDPEHLTARGALGGSPTVDGSHAKGSRTLAITAAANVTNWMRAGDYFQLGSGSTSRIYRNLKDVNTDGSGDAVLDIWPDLRAAASNGATVTTTAPKGLFRLQAGSLEFQREPMFTRIGFRAVEALTGA